MPSSCPTVYPRVYGESTSRRLPIRSGRGLSPRVRGIHQRPFCRRGTAGSIPACTGNPPGARRPPESARVYPRVYGESWVSTERAEAEYGLSPRVRGILGLHGPHANRVGSIPACTGNPSMSGADAPSSGVYPRVYGESWLLTDRRTTSWGLSPRVRGIPRGAP